MNELFDLVPGALQATALVNTAAPTQELSAGAWDITTFMTNAKNQIQVWGGLFLMLLGAAGLIWGGVLGIKKLMSNGPGGQGANWGQIILLVLVGGGFATGGWALMNTIGSGAEKSLRDLGGGTALLDNPLVTQSLTLLGLG